MGALGHDTTSLEDESFNLETALDTCILRLIASCCNEKSVRDAIALVTALKLPDLAERFDNILEEKLLNEAIGNTVLRCNCEGSIRTNNAASSKFLNAPEISKTSDDQTNRHPPS